MPKGEATTLSLERYAPEAKAWIVLAQSLADELRHDEVTPAHVLMRGLERSAFVTEAFRRAGADPGQLRAATERALSALPRGSGPAYLSSRLLDLLGRAEREADRERAPAVLSEHVLSALSQEVRGAAGEILSSFGIGPGSLRPHLGAVQKGLSGATGFTSGDAAPPESRDLVQAVRSDDGDPVIGRDAEVRRVVTILERRDKGHPLLVGEPGIGKFAIVRALARRIAEGRVPSRLSGVRLLAVDLGAVLGGARTRTDVDQRVRKLVEGARGEGEPILVLTGIEQLFSGPSGATAGDALRSALLRGEIRLIGTTTREGLRVLSDKDPAFLRELTVLEVAEPAVAQSIEVLRGIAQRLERHHGVRIGDPAIVAAVTLAKRYLQDRFLPDSAIDLLDEAAATLRVETDGMPSEVDSVLRRLESVRAQLASLEGVNDPATTATREKLSTEETALAPKADEMRARLDAERAAGAPRDVVLGEEHVAGTLAAWTGIPVTKMLEGEADRLLKMEERLERRVVGQSEAVRALSRSVRRGRVGLRDPKRPIGSFLFLGPSGVGKTELAKALAEFLFDDEAALTRLDMSEFMERHMAQRLLGAPPGYADSEQGGFLTEAVRRRPYSVLLFDEVEKAHQDVFNLLLQVLDDGRLTDGRGRQADFTNAVVILTSNIGSSRILEADPRLFENPEGREALREVLLDELGKFFRPEFLNRIDDVIVFRPLGKEHLARIVDIQLDRVRALLAPKHVRLEVDDAAKARLVELGYHPGLGARPLRRAILQHVQDPLAERLLASDLGENAALRVRLENDALVLVAEPGAGEPA